METPRRKTGSAMSDRQMARAAVDGRLITFIQELQNEFSEFGGRSISGFLVGMDAYHWMIVPEGDLIVPHSTDEDPGVILVHKSCPFVMISGSVLLADRHTRVRARVAKVGQSFWEHCKRSHLGYTATTPQEKQ